MNQTLLSPLKQIPAGIHTARDYELLARRFIAAPTLAYLAGGSGDDVTRDANKAAFAGWCLAPRLLTDVGSGHTRLRLAGRERPHPILLAPVAFQHLAHAQGELGCARAAEVQDSVLVASTLASCTLEDIAAAAGGEKWFQLYFQARRDDTLDLVRRAERAGYTALVVTLDASIQAPSFSALRAGFSMPEAIVAANLASYPGIPPTTPAQGASRIFQGLMRHAPTWADLDWLLGQTGLPVWVKGVLHVGDAESLRSRGIAGQIVSNHGGRSIDHAPASLRALPAIRAALGNDYPLLLDSGIRSGTDVYKALALGADAVLVGRLQVYALAVAGALGVAHMLRLLREELEVCMAMTGCTTLADIRRAGLISH